MPQGVGCHPASQALATSPCLSPAAMVSSQTDMPLSPTRLHLPPAPSPTHTMPPRTALNQEQPVPQETWRWTPVVTLGAPPPISVSVPSSHKRSNPPQFGGWGGGGGCTALLTKSQAVPWRQHPPHRVEGRKLASRYRHRSGGAGGACVQDVCRQVGTGGRTGTTGQTRARGGGDVVGRPWLGALDRRTPSAPCCCRLCSGRRGGTYTFGGGGVPDVLFWGGGTKTLGGVPKLLEGEDPNLKGTVLRL